MFTGKIRFFNEERGYGFIEVEDGGKDLFFHQSAVNTDNGFPTLCPDDAVTFEIGQNRKGACAENVRKLPKQHN